MRLLVAALVLALALPAQAADPVELEAGQAAPFKGSLCDAACAGALATKRKAAEDEAARLGLELQAAKAAQGGAEKRAADAEGRPDWGTLIGVTGAALVIGLAGGVALVLVAKQ